MSAPEPFRVAFLLAALTAARAIGPWFGDPATQHYYIGISRFMSGRFITMMFGLIGACLAMYQTAHDFGVY